ncbi:MAG: hypothetical protein JWO32_2815 [Bacteroidetes bacterium]|nr:hypothetical protein [Bacteroidota bacterium]
MDPNLISRLFDTQPDSVVWFIPVYLNDEVADFEVGYCNTAACEILKASRSEVLGSRLKTSVLMDETSRQRILEQCMEVWKSGEFIEFTYHSPYIDKYFNVQRSKVENGILSVTRDHTLLVQTQIAKETQAQFLNNLIVSSPYGISLYESIREKDKIKDFRMKIANQMAADITGFSLEDLQKYTVKELMLIRGHTSYFETCVKVVETGRPEYSELFVEQRNKWIGISMTKFEDGYLLNYTDITRAKSLEQQAREQTKMLENVLNNSVTGFFSLEAIRGSSGKIMDFKIIMCNPACKKMLGLNDNVIGKTYLTIFPSAKLNGLFDTNLKVIETGEAFRQKISYTGDGYDGEYDLAISKIDQIHLVHSFYPMNQERVREF